MSRCLDLPRFWLVPLIAIGTLGSLHAQPGQPKGPDARPILFEVRVPAEALIEIQGAKTMASGEARQFRTPAMPLGKKYSYTIKVSYDGKVTNHELTLTHAGSNVFDLRKDLLAGRAPTKADTGPFTLLVPPALTLRAGDAAPFTIKVKRTNFAEPIEVTFRDLPPGVDISKATIAAGKEEQSFLVMSEQDAKPGVITFEVVAKAGKVEKLSKIRLTLSATGEASPPVNTKKPEKKPTSPPKDLPQDDPPGAPPVKPGVKKP